MAKFLVLFLLVFLCVAAVESKNADAVVVTEKEDIFGKGPLPTGPTYNGHRIPVLNNGGSGKVTPVVPHIVTEKEENFGNGPLPPEIVDQNGVHIPVFNDESVRDGSKNPGKSSKNRAYNIEPEHVDFLEKNPSELPDGSPLFEGDILLTPEQVRSLKGGNVDRKAILPNYYSGWNARWPPDANGDVIIPYRITNSSLPDEAIIEKALQHWMNLTCLNFSRTNATGAFSHLYFSGENSGCYANLGRIPVSGQPGGQLVSIGPNCADLGVIAHEVGHAIGFAHEQSRNDRDNYVVVFPENIQAGKEGNFDIETKTSTHGVPYDFSSVMHYSSKLFSKNDKVTIATKDPLLMNLIGIRTGLSFRDAKLANIIYNCTAKWLNKCNIAANPCQNEGYVGKDCNCVCRPGTNGSTCSTVTRSYYIPSTCGGKVTTEGVITSPYFPGSHPGSLYCVWWIQAPPCKKPNITFTAFKTYFRSSSGKCSIGGLEIRNDSLYHGYTYCGIGPSYDPLQQDIKAGDTFVGTGQNIVLDFYSRYQGADTGFSVKVGFVDQPTCNQTTAAMMTTMKPPTGQYTTMPPATMNPTMNPSIGPTINPTVGPTMNPTMGPTMNPSMGPTMNPTMGPTMNPTMGPTMNPTMGPTMNPITQGPIVNPNAGICPPVSVYPWGHCPLRKYGTTWIWTGRRLDRRLNCWLKVRSHMCPRTLEITYVSVSSRSRIVSCVQNALMLGCRNRNRCCTRYTKRRFGRYRRLVPPTGNFDLQEYSRRLRRKTFYIKIREIYAPCHRRIILTPNSPYAIVSSHHTGRQPHCEWYVQAPPGKRIRMDFLRWANTKACSIYRKIYKYSLSIKGWYGRYLRRTWRRKCRRSMRRCKRRSGSMFIHRAGGYFYQNVRPLCSSWTPRPVHSYGNRMSISYQKFIRRRKRLLYAYPFYFVAKLSIH